MNPINNDYWVVSSTNSLEMKALCQLTRSCYIRQIILENAAIRFE